jgi:Ca-activated chloride channel homolog
MNLIWPGFLILLGLAPLLIGFYIWIRKRKRRFVVRYSSLSLVYAAQPKTSRFKQHFPFALFVVAMMSLVIALGRPTAYTTVPVGQATVMLSIDVSRSMLQTDIPPSRLRAAEQAAASFIESRASNTQIGIVVFAGFAQLVQSPTTGEDALTTILGSVTAGRGTAIGSGIIESINAIAEVNSRVAPVELDLNSQPAPVPAGSFVPDIIVVLTDGVTTTGPDPLMAAQMAADRGIRVYTIGFGTAAGSPQLEGGMFGGGGGFRRGIDEGALIQIAEITGGDYYKASSANELQQVFNDLPSYLITREETVEISVLFAAVGAYLAALAILLALLWHPLL